ncbi:dTDP-4-dehydrorhamnose reductase family protein [Pseudidiomarina sp. WS423]|uniref:dTDP-4-dehydrorhamnose reductase family protein n=1 Tax=Pseudidiomarina sp. WS423 TaxID=3425124 RepID=UPI003D6E58E6
MSNRILVLGANGMLGGSIHRYFSLKSNFDVKGTVRSDVNRDIISKLGFNNIISGVDVDDVQSVEEIITEFRPDFVFNCIGIIKQLDTAKKPVPSIKINALLPHILADICLRNDARLVHFSTDCVFAGTRGMYKESDIPDATDLYGRSKLLGEVDYAPHLTLRTSIIGHELNSNVSLIDWFLSQSSAIQGYSRAFFSGMPTVYVAKFIEDYVVPNSNLTGVYHLSAERIDKFSLLGLIKDVYKKGIDINKNETFFIDRSLDSTSLRTSVGFVPPSWNELIRMMHDEYLRDFNA